MLEICEHVWHEEYEQELLNWIKKQNSEKQDPLTQNKT